MTLRYLNEGLKDRAVTRDIDWGIQVPVEGYEVKKIYVWVEAVLGYLSASKRAALDQNLNLEDFWGKESDTRHYYIHGKDNIPFHSVILPALLMAKGGLKLPDTLLSSEYETLEGKKISTSGNWAVWVPYLLDHYDPDAIRFFFIANGPEKRDSDFSWNEFIQCHNTELVNQFGNLVNRTLVFIKKNYGLKIPRGHVSPSIKSILGSTYKTCGNAIEEGSLREALEAVVNLVRFGNRYFDEQKPWITLSESPEECAQTLYNLIQIIANLTVLFEPFIPFATHKLRELLNLHVNAGADTGWKPFYLLSDLSLSEPYILFTRLDKKLVCEETERLLTSQRPLEQE